MVFDSTQIGQASSLFCYIKNLAPSFVHPKAGAPLSSEWMLLCDDGAGEIADFIAVDPDPKSRFVTFIHVKKSDGDPDSIAVTPFSEVTSQAQKNLRDFDEHRLIEDLTDRTSDRNKHWVWRADGRTAHRQDFIAILRKLQTQAQRHVILFQPRIAEGAWNAAVAGHWNGKKSPDIGRMRQLSALLAGTEESFRRLATTFTVIGVGQPTSRAGASASAASRAAKPAASKKRRP